MDLWTAAEWVGRIGIVVFFVMSGINHLANRKAMTAYAQSKNVPVAGGAVIVTGLMMLAGAVMILVNWHPLWGCALLVAFLVPTAILMHNFWAETDPMQKANQQAHFWKNLTIASLVILYAVSVHRM
ncbi:MAG: DoxX family protein [Gemmatimonadales bacterium]